MLFKILQIRLAEAQLQGDQQNLKLEQLEKVKKMEGWREELKLLEEQKAMTLP
jgi:partner of Y14 and mago